MDKQLYYNIITSAWKLLKDNLAYPNWDSIAAEVNDMSHEYESTEHFEFANAIVQAVLAEISRIERENDGAGSN